MEMQMYDQGSRYSSMAEHLLNIYEALGYSPSPTKTKEKKTSKNKKVQPLSGSQAIVYKVVLATQFSISIHTKYQTEWDENLYSHKKLYLNVYICFIYK